jgi:O-antigen/teichoic acid export membrane protein
LIETKAKLQIQLLKSAPFAYPASPLQSDSKVKFGSKQVLLASLSVVLSSYIAYAAGLASSVITARALGPVEYGKFAYFVWLTGIVVIAFNNGVTVTLIRYVSESVGEENVLKARSQERWLKKALWLSITIIGIFFLAGYRHLGLEIPTIPIITAVSLLVLAAIAKSLYIFDVSKAKGYGEFNIEPRSSSLLALVAVLLTGCIYFFDGRTIHYVGAFVITSFLHPIFSRYLANRSQFYNAQFDTQYKPDTSFKKHLYWSGLLCIVALSTNRALETYLLNAYFSSGEVGKFIVAATLSRAGLDLVSVGLNAVLMPVLGNALGTGGQDYVANITQRAVKYMFFLGLLFSGCCYFFADPLVSLLYGQSFDDSAIAFKVLVITGGFTLTAGVFGAYLSTANLQKYRAIIAIASALIQGAVAVVTVPRFGLWGAVASTSIGGLALALLSCYACIETKSIVLQIRDYLILILIFAILLALFHIVCQNAPSGLTEIISGFGFGLSFVSLSLLCKVWNKSDLAMAKSVFSKHSTIQRFLTRIEKYTP